MHLVKGVFGFGFNMLEGIGCNFINYFWDKSRIKDLRRFDILVGINGQSVLGESHAKVVSIFRNIREGETASLLVERG